MIRGHQDSYRESYFSDLCLILTVIKYTQSDEPTLRMHYLVNKMFIGQIMLQFVQLLNISWTLPEKSTTLLMLIVISSSTLLLLFHSLQMGRGS